MAEIVLCVKLVTCTLYVAIKNDNDQRKWKFMSIKLVIKVAWNLFASQLDCIVTSLHITTLHLGNNRMPVNCYSNPTNITSEGDNNLL